MDVDGVLTSGEIIMLESGEEIKIWNVKDGFAFDLIRFSGADLKVVWITGRQSTQVKQRADDMGVDMLYQDCMEKKTALLEAAGKYNLKPEEIAYIGDDIVDIPPIRLAGLSVCPSDAPSEVKKEVDFISSLSGGRGVFREVVEIVLKSRGFWKKAVSKYISQRVRE